VSLFQPLSILTAEALSAAVRAPGRPARDAGIVPSGTLDQTAAINAAIAEAKTAGGGKLTFEPGLYLANAQIDSGVTLQGRARGNHAGGACRQQQACAHHARICRGGGHQ
jgi:hypothetical protein